MVHIWQILENRLFNLHIFNFCYSMLTIQKVYHKNMCIEIGIVVNFLNIIEYEIKIVFGTFMMSLLSSSPKSFTI